MEDKIYQILKYLYDYPNEYKTAAEISSVLGVSVRTLMRYMALINTMNIDSFEIVTSKRKGYKLEVLKDNQFYNYLNSFLGVGEFNLVQFKIFLDIALDRNKTINALETKYNYSSSSVLRVIQQMNDSLKYKGIQISKTKNEFSIGGDETKIRNYIVFLLQNHPDLYEEFKLAFDHLIFNFKEIQRKHDIHVEDGRNKLYALVSIIRISNHHAIYFSEMLRLLLANFIEKSGVYKNLKADIEKTYHLEMSEDEYVFMLLILMNPSFEVMDYNDLMLGVKPLIVSALQIIDRAYKTNYEYDIDLIRSIAYHVSNCFKDYILRNEVDNELLEQIKTNFTNEYCFALELKDYFYKVLNIEMGDADIGYLALHFANSSESKIGQYKLSTQIIYRRNLTVAKILKSRIEEKFSEIQEVTVTKADQTLNNLNEYDFNFAFEDEFKHKENIVKISPFLSKEDIEMIETLILSTQGKVPLINLCSENLYFNCVDVSSKGELLDFIGEQLINQQILNQEEMIILLEREKLTSTEIAKNIAFPHLLLDKPSFLSVLILKKPIFWKTDYIKLVLVMGINRNESNSKNAIRYLFSKLLNNENVAQIAQTTSYNDFVNILKGQ